MNLKSNALDAALESNAWPFIQAKKILERIDNKVPAKGYVLFETGYGPSGLPHIGTFGEVMRTTMVMKAFQYISDIPVKLFCFSDDMDGMRGIPDNIPNQINLTQYLGMPLTKVPDPFQTHQSFGAHMNGKLIEFLNNFEFDYEFKSASEYYAEGKFNDALIRVLEQYDEIMSIMIPTLGEERAGNYSPFLPVCAQTGKVLQAKVIERNINDKTIVYLDESGSKCVTSILNGRCKLQWKPDFGMRWYALDVDFEMYGKDHLVNGEIYSKICSSLGGRPPHQMFYEMFLDKSGKKISKSKGNGFSIEQWLRYAPKESLAFFMYNSPQKAKKLAFEVVPKSMDEYLQYLVKYYTRDNTHEPDLSSPIYHIHGRDNIPKKESWHGSISYSLILNLIIACSSDDKSIAVQYINQFKCDATDDALLSNMISGAFNYYIDYIKPTLKTRAPSLKEREALLELMEYIKKIDDQGMNLDAIDVQNFLYNLGNKNQFTLKEWFCGLYEILLGTTQGPRMGNLIAILGSKKANALINTALKN
ncbi:MAG: lysine--tRNA ligase [Proteobacteria bacterium]|nr:lysine--tRNA ligase [Pseudomonadota bacterium]